MSLLVTQPGIGKYANRGFHYSPARGLPWGAHEVSLYQGANPAVAKADTGVAPAVTSPDNFVFTLTGSGVPVIQSAGSLARQSVVVDVYDWSKRRWMGAVIDYVNDSPPAWLSDNPQTFVFPVGLPIQDIDLGLLCSDPNGDQVSITTEDPLPPGLTIAANVLTGTPAQVGTWNVNFNAADFIGEFKPSPLFTFQAELNQVDEERPSITFGSQLERVDVYTNAKKRTLIGTWTADNTDISGSGAYPGAAPAGKAYIWTADGGIYLEETSPSSALLAWAPVIGASSYNVYQNGVLLINTQDLQYTAQGLAYDTTYEFVINAVVGPDEFQNGTATIRMVSPDPKVVYMARKRPFPSVGWN